MSASLNKSSFLKYADVFTTEILFFCVLRASLSLHLFFFCCRFLSNYSSNSNFDSVLFTTIFEEMGKPRSMIKHKNKWLHNFCILHKFFLNNFNVEKFDVLISNSWQNNCLCKLYKNVSKHNYVTHDLILVNVHQKYRYFRSLGHFCKSNYNACKNHIFTL